MSHPHTKPFVDHTALKFNQAAIITLLVIAFLSVLDRHSAALCSHNLAVQSA